MDGNVTPTHLESYRIQRQSEIARTDIRFRVTGNYSTGNKVPDLSDNKPSLYDTTA